MELLTAATLRNYIEELGYEYREDGSEATPDYVAVYAVVDAKEKIRIGEKSALLQTPSAMFLGSAIYLRLWRKKERREIANAAIASS